ncbi:MAG TPA: hypothetical protein VEA40_10895 [Ramlibacter sp.]|nr:hypothetical protein [Ramlibacter sp.]
MTQPFLRFDDFEPGRLLGTHEDLVTPELLAEWQRLYPWDAAPPGQAPAAMATALVMRAYLQVAAPRPPGNVHAAQQLRLHAPPDIGEPIRTQVWCESRELRRERRHVGFRTVSTGRGERPLFEGGLRLVWAA